MIISDKYRYLFIEIPHTGSTAISKELIENYDGKEILHKHANYHEFLNIATTEQKKYFVFAGVRNPLDEAVSLYYKFLTNHKKNYTDPNKLLANGGWVTQRKIDIFEFVQREQSFGKFLRKFYKSVYTNNININKKYCDFIMRFENLDNDLTKAMAKHNMDKKRSLPVTNKTSEKGHYADYYDTSEAQRYAVKIFGPFMKEWGYEFPNDWPNTTHGRLKDYVYYIKKFGRSIYSRYVKSGPNFMRPLRDILE